MSAVRDTLPPLYRYQIYPTKTAAKDLQESGVTLNLICPGSHLTDRIRSLGVPDHEIGDAGDFGKAVAFLCSEPARYINGAALVIDGGESLAL